MDNGTIKSMAKKNSSAAAVALRIFRQTLTTELHNMN